MLRRNTLFVVTRPEPDHVRLMQLLGKKRLAAIHNPGFRLESEAEEQLKQLPVRLAAFDLVIVTSPMAARLVAAHTGAAEVEGVRFIAPGPGTGSFLEAAGIPVRWPESGGTSEHILAMTAGDTAPKRVGIVGAQGGRNLLAEEFFSRGAEVVPINVYHRVPVAPNPELVERLGKGVELAILVSSRQAFETILAGLPRALHGPWLAAGFVVSSARIAKLIREAGAQRVRIASGASDEAMLAAALQTSQS